MRSIVFVLCAVGCWKDQQAENERRHDREAAERLEARDRADNDLAPAPPAPWMRFVTLTVKTGGNDPYNRGLLMDIGQALVTYGVYPVGTDGRVVEPVWDEKTPHGHHPAAMTAAVQCEDYPSRACTLDITSGGSTDHLTFSTPESGIGMDHVWSEVANAIAIAVGIAQPPHGATPHEPDLFPAEQTAAFMKRHASP